MKLTLQTQLVPDAKQDATLRATVERFNEAANWVAGELFERQVTNKRLAQKLVYRELRDRFALTAQTAILVIHRVCEAFKRDKTIRPVFRPHAAITYDSRVMRFIGLDKVNLWTLAGRLVIPVLIGNYQAERFDRPHKQADLVLRDDGKWFLIVTVDMPEATPVPVTDFIGIDLGVKNLATTDDNTNFSGNDVEKTRKRYRQIRKTCQRTGTKSAKRKLQRVRKKESRFRKDANHCISKRIVEKAKGNAKSIAVEDLGGIGERTTARGPDARNRLKGWAFAQLRLFITYKATLAGITTLPVDPAYTSQTCPKCGHCERANRKTRDLFACRHCGYSAPADQVGAMNIRRKAIRYWATVMAPTVGIDDAGDRSPVEITYKPPGLPVGS